MNCQTFESCVTDLARGQVADAIRTLAVSHLAGCESCSRLLSEQEALNRGLAALRLGISGGDEAARESSVLARFRQLQQAPPVTSPARWPWAAGALAASAAAVALLLSYSKPVAQPPIRAENHQQSEPLAHPRGSATTSEPRPSVSGIRELGTKRKPSPVAPEAAPREGRVLATEFLPIPYTPALTQDQAGHVVRVRLPRSSMRSFGLPVSEERAFDRIQADVLLGDDGIARAIRFVSNQ